MKRHFASVGIRTADIPPEVFARFLDKIEIGGVDDCWPWTGATSHQGYGQFHLPGVASTTAARVAHAIFVGDLEPGLTIDHLCPTRCCMNPRHFEAVPHRVNVLRSNCPSARHAQRTHCPTCGHELARYIGPNSSQRYCPPCKRRNGREWMRKRRGSKPERYRV